MQHLTRRSFVDAAVTRRTTDGCPAALFHCLGFISANVESTESGGGRGGIRRCGCISRCDWNISSTLRHAHIYIYMS